jgi:hypothetical protein
MSRDFLDDLLAALGRVLPSPCEPLKEILILSGMPEETENLRYLAYNRRRFPTARGELTFSAVAVLNNRRMGHWRLEGFPRALGRLVFHPLWTRRNPMDLFLNNLRCDSRMPPLLAEARHDYTLLGILRVAPREPQNAPPWLQPVVAVPGLDKVRLQTILAFEDAHRIAG